MSSITVELDAENDAYVRGEAARLGITVEEVIRRAVDGSRCEAVVLPEDDPLNAVIGLLPAGDTDDLALNYKHYMYGFEKKNR